MEDDEGGLLLFKQKEKEKVGCYFIEPILCQCILRATRRRKKAMMTNEQFTRWDQPIYRRYVTTGNHFRFSRLCFNDEKRTVVLFLKKKQTQEDIVRLIE
jgi:hypothetical protein